MQPIDMGDIINKAQFVERFQNIQNQQPMNDQRLNLVKGREDVEKRQDAAQESEETEGEHGSVIHEKSRREKNRDLKSKKERNLLKGKQGRQRPENDSGENIINVIA